MEQMRCVLFSVQPAWAEKIFSWEKDDEIRKLAPDLTPPFKAYVYCTKDGYDGRFPRKDILAVGDRIANGQVVGEFVCTDVVKGTVGIEQMLVVNRCLKTCVSDDALRKYAAGKDSLSFIHIGDRVVYEEPVHISRFEYWKPRIVPDEYEEYYSLQYQIEKAPQSWCYVRELTASPRSGGALRWVRPDTQCKECMYRCIGPADGMCFMTHKLVAKNDWCLRGERRVT